MVLYIRRSSTAALATLPFPARNTLQAVCTHQTRNPVQAATFAVAVAVAVEIVPDPARTQDTITLCMQYADTIQQALILACPWTQWTEKCRNHNSWTGVRPPTR